MRPMRAALLWASTNAWLAERLPRRAFARRAVRRFMPGESLEEALGAAGQLRERGLPTIITQLGENVADAAAVRAVAAHYSGALAQIAAAGLDCYLSVKPTHLGLDLDTELCREALQGLAADAGRTGNRLWVDMESSAYTDATIALYRLLLPEAPTLGLCLQANLRRTTRDLEELLPLAPSIRLVKGAYAEPVQKAYASKAEVDAAYLQLARTLLRARAEAGPEGAALTGIATHDAALIRTLGAYAESLGLARNSFEVQMLYGIRSELQLQLAREGYRVRVLISYGAHWFPWYMRRLAERPANVWFVARSVFAR